MANDLKKLSLAVQREVLSYESWLTATSGFRFDKLSRQSMLPTVSVYGNHKLKVDAVLVVGDNLRAAAEATDFLLHHKKMRGRRCAAAIRKLSALRGLVHRRPLILGIRQSGGLK